MRLHEIRSTQSPEDNLTQDGEAPATPGSATPWPFERLNELKV